MKRIIGIVTLAALVQAAHGQEAKPSWTDSVRLKGDLRYRHEMIDEDGKSSRTRHRLRARLSAEAAVSDELDAAIGLASGSEDPVSSNQDLGQAFSTKNIGLDLAYVDWHPELLQGARLLAGKMKKPFLCVSDLVWDGDLNPEGLALKYKLGLDQLELIAHAGGFWVIERGSDDDTLLYTGQLAATFKPAKDAHVLAGVGYYFFDDIEGRALLTEESKSFGNSTRNQLASGATNKVYATGFEELEAFAEVKFNAGLPVKMYGQYVVNNGADDLDTGYLVGLQLGETVKPGSFSVDYNYRELERDAVVGALTDSDSFGGGTDGRGHKLSLAYQVSKNWQAGVTYFLDEKGISGKAKDYDRLQLDVVAKF